MTEHDTPAVTPTANGRPARVGLAAVVGSLVWIAIAWFALPAYGPTWDAASGEFAFGERVLDFLYGHGESFLSMEAVGYERREPQPEFATRFHWYQCYPFAYTLAAWSSDVLWTRLGLVEPIVAHHLVGVLHVAALIGVTILVVGRRFGTATGIAAAAFLVASPRFVTHAFNNLKDGPEACLYALTALGFACAHEARTHRGLWIATGIAGGCALAQKANALFLPVQCALAALLWLTLVDRRAGAATRPTLPWRGYGLLLLAAFVTYGLVSPQLWGDPWHRLVEHWREPFRVGNTATAGGGATVSFHGLFHAAIGSPLAPLAFAAAGLLAPGLDRRWRIALLIWLGVALGRTTLPGMRNFDGVRHFLEFWPAVAIAAALGLRAVARTIGTAFTTSPLHTTLTTGGLAVVAFAGSLVATLGSAPYGTSWFNQLIGGLAGARAAGVVDAGDYWASSTWEGLAWVDANAERPTADPVVELWTPLAPFVARAGAPLRVRQPFRLREAPPPADEPIADEVFVVYVMRTAWFGPFLRALDRRTDTLVHERRVQDAPILRVHRLRGDALVDELENWRREQRAANARARVLAWVAADPDARLTPATALFGVARSLSTDELETQVRATFPPELHTDALDTLWLLRAENDAESTPR